MSSGIPNTFGNSLNICHFFSEACCLLGPLQMTAFYTCSCQTGMQYIFKYNECSSNLRLWYLEFASKEDRYLTFVSLGNISLRLGPLWIGSTRAWLSLAGSKLNLICPFGFDTNKKLLLYSTVSSKPLVSPGMDFVMYRLHTSRGGLVQFPM